MSQVQYRSNQSLDINIAEIDQLTCGHLTGGFLKFNQTGPPVLVDFANTNIINFNVPAGSDSLANLSDVQLSPPINHQKLFYQTSINKWINGLNYIISNEQVIYVTKDGSDVTGDGSPDFPYLTIPFAMSQILDASSTKRYRISLGPGDYSENLSLKANVCLMGSCLVQCIISGTIDTNDPSWTSVTQDISEINSIGLNGLVNIDLLSVASSNGQVVFTNCIISSSITSTLGTVNNIFVLKDNVVNGNITHTGGAMLDIGSHYLGAQLTINSNSTVTTFLESLGSHYGNGLISTFIALDQNIIIDLASSYCLSLSLSGSGCSASATVDSIPILSNVTLLGGATLTLKNDAAGLAYTPTTPADWSVVPATVQQGLDTLASNSSSVSSNIYTPVASSLVNISAVTFLQGMWHRISSIVKVDFVIRLTTLAIPSNSSLLITLPIDPANNFTTVDQLTGTFNINDDGGAPNHTPSWSDSRYFTVQSSIAGNKLALINLSIGASALSQDLSLYGSFSYSL